MEVTTRKQTKSPPRAPHPQNQKNKKKGERDTAHSRQTLKLRSNVQKFTLKSRINTEGQRYPQKFKLFPSK